MKTLSWIASVVFLAAAGTTPALAATPESISFVAKQMNVPFEGRFKKFASRIQYDPANPAAGKAMIDVDMASVDLGQEDFNSELRTKTWLDASAHPKATFVSSAIKSVGKDQLEVRGKLTIKGKSSDVTIPVTVKTEGQKRFFDGRLPIKRTAFNIGEGEWADTTMVNDEVEIRFRLASNPK